MDDWNILCLACYIFHVTYFHYHYLWSYLLNTKYYYLIKTVEFSHCIHPFFGPFALVIWVY